RVEVRELLAGIRIDLLAAHERVGDVEAAAEDRDRRGLAVIGARVLLDGPLVVERLAFRIFRRLVFLRVPVRDAVRDRLRDLRNLARVRPEVELEVARVLEVDRAIFLDARGEHALVRAIGAAAVWLQLAGLGYLVDGRGARGCTLVRIALR